MDIMLRVRGVGQANRCAYQICLLTVNEPVMRPKPIGLLFNPI